MALKIPSSLQLKQLKNLAFQCGLSTSGTKSILTNRLLTEIVPILPNNGDKSSPTRILSIDMGIRNLAYCVLDLPSKSIEETADVKLPLPSIIAWRRLAVSSSPIADPSASIPPPKEAFDPPTLSTAAYNLLRHTLLPHNPTHILIERQRFRSMGSPHILEWTIRVNMFESMLYAVLQTLKSEGAWEGSVVPIAPGKVGPFWIDPDLGLKETAVAGLVKAGGGVDGQKKIGKKRNTKIAKLLNKGAKIDLVRSWLEDQGMVTIGTPEVEAIATAYLEKWHRLPGRKKVRVEKVRMEKVGKAEEVEEMGKLDDLADSLLQGMAWISWEENKRKFLKEGLDILTS